MKKLLVIGSINMDFVIETDKIPKIGETLIGKSVSYFPGGKGANQAVAASNMGEEVHFMGCVGNDEFGQKLIQNFENQHINTELISIVDTVPTGIASITLCNNDNSILVVEGANKLIDKDFIHLKENHIINFDYVLIQNEIPLSAIKEIINICVDNKIKVIYNPAPYKKIDHKLLSLIDYVIPNEIEQQSLSIHGNNIITTLGAKGVIHEEKIYPAKKVEVLDTTGAGDTFCGVFVAFLMKGYSVEDSIKKAQLASSLAIQKKGAQTGMPYLEDLK